MSIAFQKCTLSDLDELIKISRKTFVDAFEKHNAPEDFETYIDKAFAKTNLQKQLELRDSTFYFVLQDGVLAGYFKLNEHAAQTDLKLSEALELERIYVLGEFQGNRIGEHVIREVVRLASEKGKAFIWLGVWQKNTDAVRFYERHGFVKFGTHPYFIGNDEQTDWLMRYDLITFPAD